MFIYRYMYIYINIFIYIYTHTSSTCTRPSTMSPSWRTNVASTVVWRLPRRALICTLEPSVPACSSCPTLPATTICPSTDVITSPRSIGGTDPGPLHQPHLPQTTWLMTHVPVSRDSPTATAPLRPSMRYLTRSDSMICTATDVMGVDLFPSATPYSPDAGIWPGDVFSLVLIWRQLSSHVRTVKPFETGANRNPLRNDFCYINRVLRLKKKV